MTDAQTRREKSEWNYWNNPLVSNDPYASTKCAIGEPRNRREQLEQGFSVLSYDEFIEKYPNSAP